MLYGPGVTKTLFIFSKMRLFYFFFFCSVNISVCLTEMLLIFHIVTQLKRIYRSILLFLDSDGFSYKLEKITTYDDTSIVFLSVSRLTRL